MVDAQTIAFARQTAEGSMGDTAVRLVYTPHTADGRNVAATYVPTGGLFKCGYQPAGTAVRQNQGRESADNQVLDNDRLRLPLDEAAAFTSRDRVRITHRHEEALTTPIERAIKGDITIGVSCGIATLTGVHS